MDQIKLEQQLEALLEWAKEFEWYYWAIAGGVLLLLFVLPFIGRSSRKKKKQALQVRPHLLLDAFQIAPLGRDAFLKIRNAGNPATFVNLAIKGRNDILSKNSFQGHRLEKDKVYSILLEAIGKLKIEQNFSIEITFMDVHQNVYKQQFDLMKQTVKQAKLIKYG